jgi:protein NRD1
MGNGQPKFLEWDPTLPRDNIRVLSRTLFIGGASGTEGEIRSIFSRFGKVQTCIVNQEKRHAFVKMVNRHDAIAAKEGMDNTQDANALTKARQTRWGVGFGPRDCSDYATGVSVIPISRLTDADRKWVVTAEYGGTGGQPLQGGMVIEEPDIEIGAGVSSKGS